MSPFTRWVFEHYESSQNCQTERKMVGTCRNHHLGLLSMATSIAFALLQIHLSPPPNQDTFPRGWDVGQNPKGHITWNENARSYNGIKVKPYGSCWKFPFPKSSKTSYLHGALLLASKHPFHLDTFTSGLTNWSTRLLLRVKTTCRCHLHCCVNFDLSNRNWIAQIDQTSLAPN